MFQEAEPLITNKINLYRQLIAYQVNFTVACSFLSINYNTYTILILISHGWFI